MFSDLYRVRTAPTDDATAAPIGRATANRVPPTRMGAAWFGFRAGVSLFVLLIVFMVDNTRSVEFSFLGIHASLPLALTLLIGAVGAVILAVVVGAARLTQLRRLYRRQRL